MRKKIQVLSSETISGISKKSGKPYALTICQCVVHAVKEDGTASVQVGELMLPMGMAEPHAGEYFADFEISINRDDKRIGAQLVALTPVNAKPMGRSVIDQPPASPVASAKAAA